MTTRYLSVERLSTGCIIVCKDNVVQYMLSLLILNGRIGKWILGLSEFDLWCESANAVKGQVMADFVTHHYGSDVSVVEAAPWNWHFSYIASRGMLRSHY